MTQKNIKIFINEIYSKPPKRNYATNKTDVYFIDDTWSLDILDLKDYGPVRSVRLPVKTCFWDRQFTYLVRNV